eukprot:2341120-Pleurochrysis_carterae.AAC.1
MRERERKRRRSRRKEADCANEQKAGCRGMRRCALCMKVECENVVLRVSRNSKGGEAGQARRRNCDCCLVMSGDYQ